MVAAVSIAQLATWEDVQQAVDFDQKLWSFPLQTNIGSRGMVIWCQIELYRIFPVVVISSNGPGLRAKQELLQPDNVRVH